MQPRGVQRAPSSFFFALRRACSPLPTSAQRQRNPPRKRNRFPALQLYANRSRGGRKAGTEPSACSCLGAWRATGGRPWTVQDRTLRRTLKGERRHSAYVYDTHRSQRETDRRGAGLHTPRLRALPGHACGTLPPARLARVAPSDHGRDPSLTAHTVDVRTCRPRPPRARSATADAGAPAGLVQLEHLYTPGNCAGDAASVPSWIFSGQLAKSVRNREPLHRGPRSDGARRRGANPPRLAHGRAAASPVPHRPMSTALSAPASPLEAHTPVHVIGWERVDADTDTGNDRHAYQPPGRPRTPNPHRSLSNRASSTRLSAHPSERRPRPED